MNIANAQNPNGSKLKSTFIKVGKNTECSNPNVHLFLKEFPSTFLELNAIYGWNTKTDSPAILYDESQNHILLFEKTYKCFQNEWIEKSVGIAINGKWEADAITYFQKSLRNVLLKNPTIFFNILSKRTKKENLSFWKFVIDGPVRDKILIFNIRKLTSKNALQSSYFGLIEKMPVKPI